MQVGTQSDLTLIDTLCSILYYYYLLNYHATLVTRGCVDHSQDWSNKLLLQIYRTYTKGVRDQ